MPATDEPTPHKRPRTKSARKAAEDKLAQESLEAKITKPDSSDGEQA
mgnify:FL=1|jgi:hypothetical protein